MKETALVHITGLTNQGEGVGRLPDGRAVFVPFVAPGDEVEVALIQKKKRFARGRLQTILSPGSGRRQPQCQHFQRCGGCSWQHLQGDTQRHWKTQIVVDALTRVGKLQHLPSLLYRPASAGYELRTRARLQVDEGGTPGYFERQSHRLLEVRECPVLAPPLQTLLLTLRRHLPSLGLPVTDCRILCNEQGDTVLGLHTEQKRALRPEEETSWSRWCEQIREESGSLLGCEYWSDNVCLASFGQSWLQTEGSPLRYTASDFAQASFAMNRVLVEEVLAMVAETQQTQLLELYAGRGNFSLPLALRGARVACLEYSLEAVREGQRAAAALGLSERCQWTRWNDETDSLQTALEGQNLVLLDPPRRGLSQKVVEELLREPPEWVLYVSCDPVTLARDLKQLCAETWSLEKICLVDLMPQTPHVETVALLKRSST